jgi:hypothetical protein
MHLLATVTAHGLGHLAQTAPVIEALRRRVPYLQLTVASTLPAERLRLRIDGPFRIEARALDFGFAMHDAFRVDLPASATRYRALHADWPAQVAQARDWLQGVRPDVLLCNAAYLPLAAAAELGLPAYGMSSLNWADLFDHLYAGEPWAAPIHAQMLQAYRAATAFLKLRPGMDMSALPNSRWVGPVARLGAARRDALRRQLRLAPDEKVVLVAFGGIDARLPMAQWRFEPGLHWLVPQDWQVAHPQVSAIEALGWHFSDLLASVDALLGKPGYGSFVEAACASTPVLYAPRPGWPEQAPLVRWLQAHARAAEVDEDALRTGALAGRLQQVWTQPMPESVALTGADEVAACLAAHAR